MFFFFCSIAACKMQFATLIKVAIRIEHKKNIRKTDLLNIKYYKLAGVVGRLGRVGGQLGAAIQL